MSLQLMLLANDSAYALEVQEAGVDRVFYDLEFLNKRERQRGRNTVLSHNSIDGILPIRSVLTKSQLLVRTNPINPYLSEEIERCIDAGADILMLPMAIDDEDARIFVDLVNGRAKVCVMVETPQAFCRLNGICAVGGIDEIFIGLNDLHIGMKLIFMFEVLSGGLVDHMAAILRAAKIPFGFGGMAKIGEGLLPAENILGEHYRLGSSSVILSRTFTNHPDVNSTSKPIYLRKEVELVRKREDEIKGWSKEDFEKNRNIVYAKTRDVVHLLNSKNQVGE